MNWIVMLGVLIVCIGVIAIFDARILTKKFFSFGDQNEASMGMKIVGYIVAIVGGLIIFLNI